MVDIPILHGPFSHLPSSQVQEDRLPSLILWGPPGCGKTSFAHCVAGSTRCNFRSLRPRWRTGLVDTRIGQRLQKVMATLENLGKSRTRIYRKNKHTHTHENHTEMMITWHILKGNTNFWAIRFWGTPSLDNFIFEKVLNKLIGYPQLNSFWDNLIFWCPRNLEQIPARSPLFDGYEWRDPQLYSEWGSFKVLRYSNT
jgi:hypothetical protein